MSKAQEAGELLVQYNATREDRLELSRQSEKLKEAEGELKFRLEALMRELKEEGIAIIGNDEKQCKLKPKKVPMVKDQDAFHAHIQETGEFDLLQDRISVGAINERIELGHEVPGVVIETVYELSITKAK